MNHPKSMFQLSGVHYRAYGRSRFLKGSLKASFRDLEGIVTVKGFRV